MPNSSNRVAIEIFVDDQGSVHVREFAQNMEKGLDQVEQKSLTVTERIQAGWGKVKAAWLEITAGVLAIREAWDMANIAAKARQEEIAFANLAASYGKNSQAIIADLKEASGETISTMDLIRDAGTAMMMGIDPDTVVELMRIARATSRQTGQDVSKAFGDISLAVGRQSRMILDNLGIIVEVEKANKDYAQSLGVSADELDDNQRKQAFLNATLEGGRDLMEKLGDQENNRAERLQRITAKLQDYRVLFGDLFGRIFLFADGIMKDLAAGSLAVSAGIFKIAEGAGWLTDKLHLTSGAAERWRMEFEAAKGASFELLDEASQSFDDMTMSTRDAIEAQAAYRKEMEAADKAMKEQAKTAQELEEARKKLLGDAQKEADEKAEATRQMYQEAGLGAEQYFNMEANKLIQKAARWEKAGADTLQVENWLYEELGKLSDKAWEKGDELASVHMDSLQAQAGTLVDEFTRLEQDATQKLQAIAGEAAALDGTQINLMANFDGSAVMSGLDQLIVKFQQLQGAAASTAAAAAGGGGSAGYDPFNESTKEWLERTGGGTTNVFNFSPQTSRSDALNIINEQQRQEARS